MIKIKSVLMICSILGITKSVVLPKIKCDFMDGECKRLMYQKVFKDAADGIPSKNIPRIDPLQLDKSVSTLPNSFKLTMVDGVMTGLKNCEFDDMKTYLDGPFHSNLNMTCKVEIITNNTVEVPKLLLQELGGENIAGDVICGTVKGKIKMEKYHLHLYIPFGLEWKNGEVYFKISRHLNVTHIPRDLSVTTFTMDVLDVESKVNSEIISNYIKDNAVELNVLFPKTTKFGDFFQAIVDSLTKRPAKDLFNKKISSYVKM